MSREFISHEVVCRHCGKTYKQTMISQIPGFRDREEDICPYCNEVNRSSMEWDFSNEKMEQK